MTLLRTPLYPVYAEFGAKTVEFGGWEMPVQFASGINAEHEAVRQRVGLFDVSHMGEFEVTGPDAKGFLQHLITNDASKLEPGMAMYSPLTNDEGGCVDDLLVYCFADDHYWTVVNAGNIAKDFAWMQAHVGTYKVTVINRSEDIALLALQGPNAESLLQPLTDTALADIRFYRFAQGQVAGVNAVISRTGYTGEDGFELYVDAEQAVGLWHSLVAAGEAYGLVPCGLGARDTLRLEARLPLYGHEITDSISPLEGGLSPFVKLEASDFPGRDVLAKQKADGVPRKVVGLQMTERGIPRAGYAVYDGDREVGFITSGTMSPTLHQAIGLALVATDVATVGNPLYVDIRGKRTACEIVKTPFYKRPKA